MIKRLFELLLVVGVCVGGYYAQATLTHLSSFQFKKVEAPPSSPPALIASATEAQVGTLAPPQAGFSSLEADLMKAIFGRFSVGDYGSALKLADEATDREGLSDAFHLWLNEQMPVLLTSAGWNRLKLGDCEEALADFRRADALKKTPETTKGLAVCYYKQKNLEAARDQFAAYLDQQPQDAQMELYYTDVLESEGRYEDAVHILEQLVSAPPPDTDLTALKQRLDSMRGRARQSPQQQEDSSTNFRLTYQAQVHDDLAPLVLQTLENTLDEYTQGYGLAAPTSPIEVILYPAGDFKSIVVGGPAWAEGLFDGRLRIPVRPETSASGGDETLTVVLRHELVHALLSRQSDARQLPPWFDEGMAQRLSCAGFSCGNFSFTAKPGEFLPAPSFMTSYISLNAMNAGRAYNQSLYLIYFLEQRYGSDTLRNLVSHIGAASDLSSDGLLAPLGLSFKTLQQYAAQAWLKRELLQGVPGR